MRPSLNPINLTCKIDQTEVQTYVRNNTWSKEPCSLLSFPGIPARVCPPPCECQLDTSDACHARRYYTLDIVPHTYYMWVS